MWLIEIFLPMPAGKNAVEPLEEELTRRFGGVTAHLRAPAQGRWRNPDGGEDRDRIAIIEVMADGIDEPYWQDLKARLLRATGEKDLLIRATEARTL